MLSTINTNLLYSVCFTTSFFPSDNLLKSTGMGTSLSISNLSTSVFKLAKFDFSAKLVTFRINRFRKILTHLYEVFFSNPANELSYPLHLTYNLSPSFLITFSIINSC